MYSDADNIVNDSQMTKSLNPQKNCIQLYIVYNNITNNIVNNIVGNKNLMSHN